MKKATIIIPTYNEVKNVEQLIEQLSDEIKNISNWEIKILVVDSFSPDKTANLVKSMQKKISNLYIIETKREGLGKAYVAGFEYALEKFNPYLLFEMDADFSHDPKIISGFIKCIEKGADFVIGSRYIKGGSIPKNWGLHRKVFSVFGNLIVRFGFMKLKISDWTSGYRAVKTWVVKSALKKIKNYSGYVFQVALLDNAIKNQAIIKETPLNFIDRRAGVSKINSLQYIMQTLFYVLLNSSFIKYFIVGLIGFTIDFGLSFILIEKVRAVIWLATLLSTETAIICNFFLNNSWSFSHKRIESGKFSYLFKFIKFNFVSAGSIIIQSVGIQISTMIFGIKFWYLYKVIIIAFIIIPYSYFLYNKFIWKEK